MKQFLFCFAAGRINARVITHRISVWQLRRFISILCCLYTCLTIDAQSANTNLSNLTAPTAVNTDLIPAGAGTQNLGTIPLPWKNLHLQGDIYVDEARFLSNYPGPGSLNTFIGSATGNAITTGFYNTGVGHNSMFKNTKGSNNTAVGVNTLYNNSLGNFNTALGRGALYKNTLGSANVAIGHQALTSNATGNVNVAIGISALSNNKTGSNMIAIGDSALFNSDYYYGNIAIGSKSLFTNSSGWGNTAIGYRALYLNESAYENTAIGYQALYHSSSGISNTAIGSGALYANTTGDGNTATGKKTLYFNTTGSSNTATGRGALYYNITGSRNTASGESSLNTNSSGSGNTATGFNTLFFNSTGSGNTANGISSLFSNKSGSDNTATGTAALFRNDIESYNAAYGSQSLYNTKNCCNTAVGYQTLYNNIYGYFNTSLGYWADASESYFENATAIGYNAIVNASNKIRLGNSNTSVVESTAGWWTVSDGRFKNNIRENVKGLDFINLLKPVTYTFDTKKYQELLVQNYPDSIKNKRLAAMNKNEMAKSSIVLQSGFIAQDVAEAVKKSGYDFNGVHTPENATDNWSLSYEKLVIPLVKAVQELSAKNDELQKEINELKTILSGSQNTSAHTQALSNASLQQNVPNPFTRGTSIAYTLPQKFKTAQIIITDAGGKTLKKIKISGPGSGKLDIDAATLASGAYSYSLIMDGELVSVKQMILAK